MSQDLIPFPTFEGHEIRALDQDGLIWIPTADLTRAWGLHRNTLRDVLTRNKKRFEGFTTTGAHETRAAGLRLVNELGLYLLMGMISSDRVKDPAAAEAILRFQRWVPQLIQRFRRGEIIQRVDIKAELEQARHYAGLAQGDPRHFQAAIFRKHGMPEYSEALLASIPSLIHGEAGWFNPSQLVPMCHDPLLTAERLNWYLCNNPKDPDRRPFQYRDMNHLWRLTPLGWEHGKEYLYTAQPSGHSEIRIAWRKSILVASGLLKEGS